MSNALDNSLVFEKKKLKIPIFVLQGLDAKHVAALGIKTAVHVLLSILVNGMDEKPELEDILHNSKINGPKRSRTLEFSSR